MRVSVCIDSVFNNVSIEESIKTVKEKIISNLKEIL